MLPLYLLAAWVETIYSIWRVIKPATKFGSEGGKFGFFLFTVVGVSAAGVVVVSFFGGATLLLDTLLTTAIPKLATLRWFVLATSATDTVLKLLLPLWLPVLIVCIAAILK